MNNKFLGTLIVFISLFIILLFTSGEFYKIQELMAEKDNLIAKQLELDSEHKRLKNISKKLDKNNGDTFDQELYSTLEKYSKSISEDNILKFIYSEIYKLNSGVSLGKTPIVIKNLTITEAKENLMKFLESNVTLTINIQSEQRLLDVLKMIHSNNEYKFFITSLDYEVNKNEQNSQEGFEVSIPFKVFYK